MEEHGKGTPSAVHKFRQPIATLSGRHLFPRASPLQKQSTGLFLNSPPARGISSGVFRRLRTATRDSVSGLCKPLKRLDLNFPLCSPRLLFRTRVTKYPYGCRVSGANDYANCTKCKGPGSLLPGGGPGRAAPGGSGARVSGGHLSAAG